MQQTRCTPLHVHAYAMQVKRSHICNRPSVPCTPALHNSTARPSIRREIMPQNIYIIGAQSTGKTTRKSTCEEEESEVGPADRSRPVVNALKDHFSRYREADVPEPIIISEIARTVLKELHISRQDIASSPEKSLKLQTAILHAQLKAEVETESAGTWYIADRSGLDPIVYARLSVSEEAARDLLGSPEWMSLEKRMKTGVVFVCEAGTSWLVDDGVRWFPDSASHWNEFDQAFRQLLKEREISYHLILKDVTRLDDRVNVVLVPWQGDERAEVEEG